LPSSSDELVEQLLRFERDLGVGAGGALSLSGEPPGELTGGALTGGVVVPSDSDR